jgi:hypothetical protein
MSEETYAEMFRDFAPWAKTLDRNDRLIPGYFTTADGQVWAMHFNPFQGRDVPIGWCRLLRQLSELRIIELEGSRITPEQLQAMSGVSSLTSLTIDFGVDFTTKDFRTLSTYPRLSTLDVGFSDLKTAKAFFSAMGNCLTLDTLRIRSSVSFDACLFLPLSDIPNLNTLKVAAPYPTLSGTFPFASLNIDEISLDKLGLSDLQTGEVGMSQSRSLTLSRMPIGDDSIVRVAQASGLRSLDILHSSVTSSGLASLGGSLISELHYAHGMEPVSKEALDSIASIPTLERLSVCCPDYELREFASNLMPDCEIDFDAV